MKALTRHYLIHAPMEKVRDALVEFGTISRWGGEVHAKSIEVKRWRKLVQVERAHPFASAAPGKKHKYIASCITAMPYLQVLFLFLPDTSRNLIFFVKF